MPGKLERAVPRQRFTFSTPASGTGPEIILLREGDVLLRRAFVGGLPERPHGAGGRTHAKTRASPWQRCWSARVEARSNAGWGSAWPTWAGRRRPCA